MLIHRVEFDEYICRDAYGDVLHFKNRIPWKLYIGLWHMLRLERRRRKWRPWRFERYDRALRKASKIAETRRWIPINPLCAHQMWVEDKLRGR